MNYDRWRKVPPDERHLDNEEILRRVDPVVLGKLRHVHIVQGKNNTRAYERDIRRAVHHMRYQVMRREAAKTIPRRRPSVATP